MLLILSISIPNRFRFIADLMMRQMLGLEVRHTTSREEFTAYDGPKISYAGEPIADGLFIAAAGLLFETAITPQKVTCSMIDGVHVLFETDNPLSAFRFDPFAAAFYLVSRYEEYHPHMKDNFGRYPATESIAWKGKFLDIPIIHQWADIVEASLRERYPALKFRHPQYHFVPTIDIDHAWCYKGRTLVRTLGGFSRSVLHGNLHEIACRFKTLAGMAPDPYDTYSFIDRVHQPHANFPLFFILFADYGRNDNNVRVTSKNFHSLLRKLDHHGKVGIHPSLASGTDVLKLEHEYKGLCEALFRNVTISRQHFLKLSMPGTFRSLIQIGITDDYSMGYASHTGFRAGIAIPFHFFDLSKDETTGLVIHPVSLMDVTMKDYLRLNKVETLDKIRNVIQTIRSVNGEFVSLWHNESLTGAGHWEGSSAIYEEMVQLAST